MEDFNPLDSLSDEQVSSMDPPEFEGNGPEEETDESAEIQESSDEGSEEPEQQEVSTGEIDYKEFYNTVMSPIKANGRQLQLRTPEEAIKLMQQGANYTQKMQTIAPYRKKIKMLENAGLLEDEKLNYLIDLSQGNPEAVKKLLRDNKLDPLDIDIDREPAYTPGNHTVTDEEVQFQSVVDDLRSTPEGLETLRLVQGWDQASLSKFWTNPKDLAILNEHRQNGVFDLINNEIERRKIFGEIPESTSYLDTYMNVGMDLLRQKEAAAQQQEQSLPVGTLNRSGGYDAQVKSAAPSGRSRKQAQQFIDPFSLSDEDFERQFKNYAI